MLKTSMYSYTSLEVLGNIDLPKDTTPLSGEKTIRLNEFFKDYVMRHLLPAEHNMVVDDGYQWLALANPNDFKEGITIQLLPIYDSDSTSAKPVFSVISDKFIPRNKWGLYLFKFVR